MSGKEPSFTFLPAIPSASSGSKVLAASTGGSRAVGGKSTSGAVRPPRHASLASSANVAAIQRLRRDPGADPPPITESDLSRGILSCLDRGVIPKSFKIDDVMAGQYNSAPINVGAAKMHRHIDQFKRQEVLTSNLGFGQMMNVKLDLEAIERLPAVKPPEPTIPKEIPVALPVAQSPAADARGSGPQAADADLPRDDARTYQQLLDLYSLHEFIIRKGQTLRNTPEFVSYQRSFQQKWGAIQTVITMLEELLAAYGVPLAYIDGKKLAQLATVDLGLPTKDELLSCIANRAEVEPLMLSQIQQFHQGTSGHNAAATRIQSIVRMWLQRRAYNHLRAATRAAMLIQRQWNVHKAHMKTRKTINVVREGLTFRWRETMDQFIRDWPRIRQSRRLIIHIPSLSYPAFQCKTIPFFNCMQAAQLMRLADLRDPNVEVVLLSPFKIEDEALQYYMNTLKMAGARDPESRVMILVPEHAKRLPSNLSLTKLILLSSKVMKVLGSLVRGKTAYIVPGVVSNEELVLAAKLNLALLSAEPKVAQVLGSKSGSKSVFESAEVVTPVGAYHVKDTRDMYMILARFIAEYRDVGKWLVKIDCEAGSRGHAVFDVAKLKSAIDDGDANPQIVAERVLQELKERAGKLVKILNTVAHPDWAEFSKTFDSFGGCIEAVPSFVVASPTANLLVEPDGTVNLLSVVEQVFSPALCVLGCSFPQTTTPHQAIRDAALSIGAAAFRKKIMGHISVDFVVHQRNSKDPTKRLWAVDLDLHLTTNAAIHQYVELVTGATFDPQSGTATMPATASRPEQPLAYVYSGLIYNPYIGAIRHAPFFNHCRQRGLSFDLQSRTGVMFHLVDTLLKGCLGAVCVSPSYGQCVSLLSEVQQLVQAEIAKDADSVLESNYAFFVAAVKHLAMRSISEKKGDKRSRHGAM